MAWVIRSEDRRLFKSCRRAWDFGARERRNLEPRHGGESSRFADALREALAVYYFPGMWSWERPIVEPLAIAALRRRRGLEPADLARGEDVLARYFDWARPLDRFTPIRTAAEFDVSVPAPERAGGADEPLELDLVAPDGRPVRFRGRIDLLIQDENEAYWLVEHRLVAGEAIDETALRLDEAGAARCWAWESFFLGMEIRGTIYNQILLDPSARERFRRTVVARSREELAGQRLQMAHEILDMLDAGLRVYPSPAPERCAACPFVRPCVAMTGGADPRPFLVAEFRERVDATDEPQLGRETWPSNRALATGRLRQAWPRRN